MKKNALKITLLFTTIISLFMLNSCSSPKTKAEKGWERYKETYAETYNRTSEHMEMYVKGKNVKGVYIKDVGDTGDVIYYEIVDKKYSQLKVYFIYLVKENAVSETNAKAQYEVAVTIADDIGYFST